MKNREIIKDLLRNVNFAENKFVEYVLDNDNEAPNEIKSLCYQYFEEWNKDAKILSINKPSQKIYYKILTYYLGD